MSIKLITNLEPKVPEIALIDASTISFKDYYGADSGTEQDERLSKCIRDLLAAIEALDARVEALETGGDDPVVPTIITFTIDGDTYTVEEGTTWYSWCLTVSAFTCENSTAGVFNNDKTRQVVGSSEIPVYGNTVIISNGAYQTIEVDEPDDPATITFTIDGTVYEATDGTSWLAWCTESTSDFNCNSGTSAVLTADGSKQVVDSSGNIIYGSNIILANGSYSTEAIEEPDVETVLVYYGISKPPSSLEALQTTWLTENINNGNLSELELNRSATGFTVSFSSCAASQCQWIIAPAVFETPWTFVDAQSGLEGGYAGPGSGIELNGEEYIFYRSSAYGPGASTQIITFA